MTVWKFPLRLGEAWVSMPMHAKVLHVDVDPASGHPAVWALVVEHESQWETRRFVVVGTGHPVPRDAVHLGSFIDDGFVGHVFEIVAS